jgi:ABC-type Fe3+-hydroxamate transport system substrate-binding protein
MNPRTLADVFSDIEHLGGLLGRKKRAASVVRQMRARMQRITAQAPNRRRPRVYCEAWPKPRLVSPAWVEEMVALAGGRFVPKPKSPSERAVTDQAVLRAKPDVIVLGWAACGLRVDPSKVLRRPGWRAAGRPQPPNLRCQRRGPEHPRPTAGGGTGATGEDHSSRVFGEPTSRRFGCYEQRSRSSAKSTR